MTAWFPENRTKRFSDTMSDIDSEAGRSSYPYAGERHSPDREGLSWQRSSSSSNPDINTRSPCSPSRKVAYPAFSLVCSIGTNAEIFTLPVSSPWSPVCTEIPYSEMNMVGLVVVVFCVILRRCAVGENRQEQRDQ